MSEDIMTYECIECNGRGYLYWAIDRKEYDVKPCGCRDGELFTNGENE
jgi:hypothetical protein